ASRANATARTHSSASSSFHEGCATRRTDGDQLEPSATATTVAGTASLIAPSRGRRRRAPTAAARILSALTYPERIVPDETEPGIVALHLKRYEFALPWCRD